MKWVQLLSSPKEMTEQSDFHKYSIPRIAGSIFNSQFRLCRVRVFQKHNHKKDKAQSECDEMGYEGMKDIYGERTGSCESGLRSGKRSQVTPILRG